MHDIERVIDGGYCIGCGVCALVPNAPITMAWNGQGQIQARLSQRLSDETGKILDSVCPFSNNGPHEQELGNRLERPDTTYSDKLGFYAATYAGHVEEGDFRTNASSGGYASWIANELVRTGRVDYVVHVRPVAGSDTLFAYAISDTTQQVQARSKTRYYPVEMSEVLQAARTRGGRFALIGVPCFIKAAGRLLETDSALAKQLVYRIAIICGHHKSAHFGESLAWQMDVEPGQALAVDFRRKIPDRSANRYGFAVTDRRSGVESVRPMKSLVGDNWAHGAFRAKACDYCDDVVGETADVSIGDAWLPAYIQDPFGANVVIVRSEEILALTEEGRRDGRLALDAITPEDAIKSQASGFRHRREGLGYRLWLQDRAGRWRPRKRVMPSAALPPVQKQVFRLRMLSSQVSHRSYVVARRLRLLPVYTAAFEAVGVALRALQRINARKSS